MASVQDRQVHSLPALEKALGARLSRLPVVDPHRAGIVLRHCDGKKITEEHFRQLANWKPKHRRHDEIPFVLAKFLLQEPDRHPVPPPDLAAMRSVAPLGQEPKVVEPLVPWISSWTTPSRYHYGVKNALDLNMKLDVQRNQDALHLHEWAMQAFDTFRVVPPGIGMRSPG